MTSTLELIRSATGDATTPPKFPVVINPTEIFPKLTPSPTTISSSLVHPVSGWEIPASTSETVNSINQFGETLTQILKNPKRCTRDDVLRITTFPTEKFQSLAGSYVVGLVVDACVVLDLWDTLAELIVKGVVCSGTDLVAKLVSKNKAELLCTYIRHVSDLRCSELVAILALFLKPTKESFLGMVDVKKEWEQHGVLAMKAAISPDATSLMRETSVLLMMACDGFSPSESCLHYLFSSASFDDGLVMASVIGCLGRQELLRLLRYFRKWIEKYLRFPEATPCKLSIPTLEAVAMGLGLVFDQHFGYLVTNTEFHGELKMLEGVVRALVGKANVCCGLANVIEYLQEEDQNQNQNHL